MQQSQHYSNESQKLLSPFASLLIHLFTAFLRIVSAVASLKMDLSNNPVIRLRAQIASLEGILADLKTQLADAETYNKQTASAQVNNIGHLQTQAPSYPPAQRVDYAEKAFESFIDLLRLPQEDRTGRSWELTPEEHKRYGRQLIMPEIGLRGGHISERKNAAFSYAAREQDSYD